MKLLVVAVGDRLPAWVDDACREYLKRMPRKLELIAIKPARAVGKSIRQNLALEAGRISAALPKDYLRIALDEGGESWTTATLARRLAKWKDHGQNVAFIIGGADGLAADFKTATTLSLSALTLPHGLARVVLIEQLYRAFSILDNHPYHRA
ncbi:MAG: 23S rRNA (pseudouridine(1915)-N(3))-methyltransferase RlmH [Burkholderiales bacterium]